MIKPGQLRHPKEPRGDNEGTLRYEAETKTWNCTRCEQSIAEDEARRATTHAATHTKAEKTAGEERTTNDAALCPEKQR